MAQRIPQLAKKLDNFKDTVSHLLGLYENHYTAGHTLSKPLRTSLLCFYRTVIELCLIMTPLLNESKTSMDMSENFSRPVVELTKIRSITEELMDIDQRRFRYSRQKFRHGGFDD